MSLKLKCVEGYDITGRRLFSTLVQARDKDDARVLAGAKMKETEAGARKWSTSVRLEVYRVNSIVERSASARSSSSKTV